MVIGKKNFTCSFSCSTVVFSFSVTFRQCFFVQSNCLLLLLEVFNNHYKKENICASVSNQRRDAVFWIHLRQTWLNLFGLILAALSFSTFIFSIGIKDFIQHPVVLFGILILLEQVDDFARLSPWCILKDRHLCLHKYLKYWVLYPIIV